MVRTTQRSGWRTARLSLVIAVLLASMVSAPGATAAPASQTCSPRPRVGLAVVRDGDGRVRVTITAGSGVLERVEITPTSATIDVVGGPTGQTEAFTVTPRTGQLTLTATQLGGTGPGARLTVVDACGPWPTFFGAGAQAFRTTVTGQIRARSNGLPVAGARVSVAGTPITASTDASGQYTLTNVPVGTQTLQIEAAGYTSTSVVVEVLSGRQARMSVVLASTGTATAQTDTGIHVTTIPPQSASGDVQRLAATFDNVVTPGTTTFAATTLPAGVPAPTSPVVSSSYYQITTTAAVDGAVHIEIPFDQYGSASQAQASDDGSMSPQVLSELFDPLKTRVLRWTGSAWEDVTETIDTTRRVVVGTVDRLREGTVYVIVTVENTLIGMNPDQDNGTPRSGRNIIFIPGIEFAKFCEPISPFDPTVILEASYCDRPSRSAAFRGEQSFKEIVTWLKTDGTRGQGKAYPANGSAFLYYSYGTFNSSPSGQLWRYSGADTRQSLITSADLLGAQIDVWRASGGTFDIIAHSLGGAVAQTWAAREPLNSARRAAVRSIITLDSPIDGINPVAPLSYLFRDVGGTAGFEIITGTAFTYTRAAYLPNMRIVNLANSLDPLVNFLDATRDGVGCDADVAPCVYEVRQSDLHGGIKNDQRTFEKIDRVLEPGRATLTGSVVNALTGQAISNAQIQVVETGPSTTASGSGAFTLSNIVAGNRKVAISASGYQSLTQTVLLASGASLNRTFSLAPLAPAGEMRIVLNWGSSPSDLDAHLSGPNGQGGRFHAYWSSKNPVRHAGLDIDDTTSFGPETLTIRRDSVTSAFVPGEYRMWVHNYSNRTGGSTPFSGSGATVTAYLGGPQPLVFSPANASGDTTRPIWHVLNFTIDNTGRVTALNVVQQFDAGDTSTIRSLPSPCHEPEPGGDKRPECAGPAR